MRVIGGTARSLPLKTIEGMDTRPTTDRIKETLFNMLRLRIPGCRFLDLFAGCGGIGIEALSRGAACAVFVDRSRRACACIEENLAFTHLSGKAEVLTCDVLTAVKRLDREQNEPFDVIFMDPPYRQGLEEEVCGKLSGTSLLGADTLVIVEASLETEFLWAEELGFRIEKEKRYKTNKHVWMRKDET